MGRSAFPRDQFQDTEGNVLVGASVEIRRESDNGLATVYAAKTGSETLSQPLTTNGNGRITAYLEASPDGYRVDATLGSLVTSRRHVAVGTLAEHDWPVAAEDVTFPGDQGIDADNVLDAILAAAGSGGASSSFCLEFIDGNGDGEDCFGPGAAAAGLPPVLLLSPADELDPKGTGKKTGELDAGTLAPTGLLHFVDAAGVSRQITLDQLKTWINTDPTVVPSSEPHRGVLLRRSSSLSVANNDIITWQTALYDTDSMWAIGSPTRITVPANVTKMRFFAGVEINVNETFGSIIANFARNGVIGDLPAIGRQAWRSSDNGITSNRNSMWTPTIPVVGGEYYEIVFFADGLGGSPWTLSSTPNVFFAAEIVEASAP